MRSGALERIKQLAIIAMFSDDDLMDRLVLKGGNLLDVVYGLTIRGSVDLDFSLEDDFSEKELTDIEHKIRSALTKTFRAEGYEAFDIEFVSRPEKAKPETPRFWGGYRVEFKVIDREDYERLRADVNSMRREATIVGPSNKRVFRIDISKFEYCVGKQEREMEGFTIYVYSPAMVVLEKLRAICQQMPDYLASVGSTSARARARDFFDIHTVLTRFELDLASEGNLEILKNIFAAKNVPLCLIDQISRYRDYHRQDFAAVRDTVSPGTDLHDFDYYFDFVVDKCKALQPLWKEQSPPS